MSNNLIDPRLEFEKQRPRAMQSYVLMMYEFVLERRPNKILEIGVQRGQSTKTMLMALSKLNSGKLISIDHKNRSGILDEKYADLKQYWEFITGDSHSVGAIQAAFDALDDGEEYDMLFIDGDHKMPGVKQDFDEYSKLVKPGGLIMLHDIVNTDQDVHELWDEITWEKFSIDWGRSSRSTIIPGFGIVKKPY